jgi:hypothetical protein
MSTELLKKQDMIIIAANDIPLSLFDEVSVDDNTCLFFKDKKIAQAYNFYM